jgi:hypothetical protein
LPRGCSSPSSAHNRRIDDLKRVYVFLWGLASAGVMVLGAIGPWIEVGGLVSIDGTDDGRDGWVVIGAAAVGALAFALWMRGRWWSLLAALAAGAGLATTIYDRLDLEGTVAGIDVGRFLEAGWGLYVAMAGSASLAAAAVGALITSNTLARWATSND